MIVVFDTETAGFDGDICEFGSVIITDSGKRFSFNERAKPSVPISEGAYKTHGISDEDVAHCRPEKEVVLEWIQDVLDLAAKEQEEVVFCAHNLQFDQRMIKPFVDIQKHHKLCTLKLAKEMLPDNDNHKLGTLYAQFGQGNNHTAHSALDDCLMLAEILPKLLGPRTYYQAAKLQQIVPKMLQTIEFGKHKGKAFNEVPKDYLEWIYSNHSNVHAVFTAGVLLGKEQRQEI